MTGFASGENLTKAIDLVNEMTDKKITPNHITFTILIDYHCKAGMIKEAEELFIDMQNRNLKPTNFTYMSLLHGYNKVGNRSKMFSAFENLVERGIEPDELIYSMMIGAYFKGGHLEKGFKLWDLALDKGLLDGLTNETLVETLSGNGEISRVMELLDRIGNQGYNPCLAMCSTLIHGLNKAGYSGRLDKILEIMKGYGWIPKSTALNEFIDLYQISANSESVSNLAKQAALEVACQV